MLSHSDTETNSCWYERANSSVLSRLLNCTFSTNRLYCAFDKYVAVKEMKLMRKLKMLGVGNTYNKPLQ